MMIAAKEAEVADPALIKDLEWESLLLQGLEIVAMCTLFTLAGEESRDIMKIIYSCIKEVKKCKTQIKLCVWYKKHKGCKQPNLNASTAIASWMGKGAYFAHQI